MAEGDEVDVVRQRVCRVAAEQPVEFVRRLVVGAQGAGDAQFKLAVLAFFNAMGKGETLAERFSEAYGVSAGIAGMMRGAARALYLERAASATATAAEEQAAAEQLQA